MAVKEKDKGNEAYRAGDYREALHFYNSSIAMNDEISVFNNRAMTYIKLNNYESAVRDCTTVLNSEPMNIKARLRRALAYEHLGKRDKALEDYEIVLKNEPQNTVARKAIGKLKIPKTVK